VNIAGAIYRVSKMATALFAETLEQLQHMTLLYPENRNCFLYPDYIFP
jgi:hypothetical protein